MKTKDEQLKQEKDFIILRSSNYHYDLGIEHEKERIVGLIDEVEMDAGTRRELKKRITG